MTRVGSLTVLFGALAACSHPHSASGVATATDGVAIAIYRGDDEFLGVVDDRRSVTIANGELVLDQVPAGASLASLTIEPLGGSPLVVGACTRDAIEIELGTVLEETPQDVRDAEAVIRARIAQSAAMEERPAPDGPRRPRILTRTQSIPTIRCRVEPGG